MKKGLIRVYDGESDGAEGWEIRDRDGVYARGWGWLVVKMFQ